MSYQERKTIVSIVTGALILIAYGLYTSGQYQAGVVTPGDLKFWASSILIFIGIGIVATIIIQIVFHILTSIAVAVAKKIQNENCSDQEIEKSIGVEFVEDEMDRLIELKSMQISFVFAGIGFVASLVSLLLGYSAVVMLNILFVSFSGGSLLDGLMQLYFYRKGVNHA